MAADAPPQDTAPVNGIRVSVRVLLVLLVAAAGVVAAPESSRQDELERLLRVASERVGDDPEASLAAASAAVDLARGLGDERAECEALFRVGESLQSFGRHEEALAESERAIETCTVLGDENLLAGIENRAAVLAFLLAEYDRALELAMIAMQRARRTGNGAELAQASYVVGLVYRDLDNLDEALKMFQAGAREAGAAGVPSVYLRCRSEEGNVLLMQGRRSEAAVRMREALDFAKKTGDAFMVASCAHDLAGIEMMNGRLVQASEAFRAAYDSFESLGQDRERALTAANLASTYLAMKRPDDARRWAEHALEIVEEAELPSEEETVTRLLAEVVAFAGDHEAAYRAMSRAYELRQERFNTEMAQQVGELRGRLDLERKEHQIVLLERDQEIRVLQLRRERLIRWAGFGALVLVTVLATALARGYRIKVRANRTISETNTRLAAARDELDRLSRHDPLTGLANRREIEERLGFELARAARTGRPFAVVIADIDDFKQINDTYGHPVGDDVLRGVAEVLRRTLRDLDTAGRWGGEEFILVLPETSAEGGRELAQKVRLQLAEASGATDWPTRAVTLTAGVAACAGGDVESCVRRADEALYEGKRSGKDRVVVATNGSSADA